MRVAFSSNIVIKLKKIKDVQLYYNINNKVKLFWSFQDIDVKNIFSLSKHNAPKPMMIFREGIWHAF